MSPCQLVSDNGLQFVSAELQKLTKEWDMTRNHFPLTIVKLKERQRLLLNLLRRYFAILPRVETISTWDFSLNAEPHHKELEAAQFRGS